MIGVIGGSGFYTFFDEDARSVDVETPYGPPSAPITVGVVGDHEVAFLPRHGVRHEFSPHAVPYRANMWALRSLGVRRIFGPCAVGSLTPELGTGATVVPDQLVDRTSAREDTYFDSGGVHVGFADPYCPTLRRLVNSALPEGVNAVYELVFDGLDFAAVEKATGEGVLAATRCPGVKRITAGNYGGKLGPHHIHLHRVLGEV